MRKIPSVIWIILVIQSGFIIFSDNKEFASTKSLLFYGQLIITFLNIVIIFWLVTILFSKFKKISGTIIIITIYLYTILILYHYFTGTNLDFKTLWDFRHDIINSEVLGMMYNFIGLNTTLFLIILSLILIMGHLKWKLFSNYNSFKKPLLQFIIFSCALIILNILPINSMDEIAQFSRSFVGWNRIQSFKFDTTSQGLERYPYINIADSNLSVKSKKELPNIFFIVIESFNASFIEQKTDDGKEITPFFNSLIPKGIYIEHFYANSVITVKGHLSILFSILPSYRGLESEEHYSNNFQSLAQILRSVGYKTIFFLGSDQMNVQNEGSFLAKNGFEICKGTYNPNENYIRNNEKSNYNYENPRNESGLGGFKDYVLYKQFFNTLDSLHNNTEDHQQKYFGFLSTYSSHLPWLREREDPTVPFNNSNSIREDYANSLFRVDSYLKTFYNELRLRKYLENSIIVITGDHSTPSGERGNFHKGVGFYEENFKTPFLLLWNNIEPMRIKNQAWSQIDIAPTLLDLLNINVITHFIGKSFLRKNLVEDNVVFLSQSFGGLNLAIIVYPYKYVYDVPVNQEYLFNLGKDPNEINDIINQSSEKLNFFRGKITLIKLNQYLLEQNRIWPEHMKNLEQTSIASE